jgi:FkbM family methyltransferase
VHVGGDSVGRIARAALPPRIARHVIGVGNWAFGEREIRLARAACDSGRLSVDVGANFGAYTYWLARWSQRCYAFEPHPVCADFLRRAFGRNVQVEEVALSSAAGAATLQVPRWRGRLVEAGAYLAEPGRTAPLGVATSPTGVVTQRLDDFALGDVAFIKIDTEGHELAVLEGSVATLERSRPRILVECEERHRASAALTVHELLTGLGYEPFESGIGHAESGNHVFVHREDHAGLARMRQVAATLPTRRPHSWSD